MDQLVGFCYTPTFSFWNCQKIRKNLEIHPPTFKVLSAPLIVHIRKIKTKFSKTRKSMAELTAGLYGIRTKCQRTRCQKTCTDKMPEDKIPENKMHDNPYPHP